MIRRRIGQKLKNTIICLLKLIKTIIVLIIIKLLSSKDRKRIRVQWSYIKRLLNLTLGITLLIITWEISIRVVRDMNRLLRIIRSLCSSTRPILWLMLT